MINVLIVDDSAVFRSQIRTALEGESKVTVVGTASNGRIALERIKQFTVDVITLDLEMPEMGGLETLRNLRAQGNKTRVIVFASQTTSGAEQALDALSAGADDIVSKPSGESVSLEESQRVIRERLLPKVLQFDSNIELPPPVPARPAAPEEVGVPSPASLRPGLRADALVVGSSTGGPVALEAIFSPLRGPLPIPIFIVQHMPPVFTASLAKRIEVLTGIPCAEAKHGEVVVANRIYIAPGDYHMALAGQPSSVTISLDQRPQRNFVRPCVDTLFESAARIYKDRLCGFVLTGMGSDGREGAQAIRQARGSIVIQNKASCVVFGMPGAVFSVGAFDQIATLEEIGLIIQKLAGSARHMGATAA